MAKTSDYMDHYAGSERSAHPTDEHFDKVTNANAELIEVTVKKSRIRNYLKSAIQALDSNDADAPLRAITLIATALGTAVINYGSPRMNDMIKGLGNRIGAEADRMRKSD